VDYKALTLSLSTHGTVHAREALGTLMVSSGVAGHAMDGLRRHRPAHQRFPSQDVRVAVTPADGFATLH